MKSIRFRVYFNRRKQWFDVFVSDNARRFMARDKCYAYYQPARDRRARKGLFGEIHLSRMGNGLVAHELLHLLIDWVQSGRGGVINARNEERIVIMFGEMVRNFWRLYYAEEKKITI